MHAPLAHHGVYTLRIVPLAYKYLYIYMYVCVVLLLFLICFCLLSCSHIIFVCVACARLYATPTNYDTPQIPNANRLDTRGANVLRNAYGNGKTHMRTHMRHSQHNHKEPTKRPWLPQRCNRTILIYGELLLNGWVGGQPKRTQQRVRFDYPTVLANESCSTTKCATHIVNTTSSTLTIQCA